MSRDELRAWIEDLRGRLERGELANHPPIELHPWSRIVEVERFVRATLASVDSWRAMPPEQRRGTAPDTIQRDLVIDLVALHERIVLGQPCPPINYRTHP
jgi:hypothetical protein